MLRPPLDGCPLVLVAPVPFSAGGEAPEERDDWRTSTDDYSNLAQILK